MVSRRHRIGIVRRVRHRPGEVPVDEGEIKPKAQARPPARLRHLPHQITPTTGRPSSGEVGRSRIPEAEPLVMLRRQHDATHPRPLSQRSYRVRIEALCGEVPRRCLVDIHVVDAEGEDLLRVPIPHRHAVIDPAVRGVETVVDKERILIPKPVPRRDGREE